MAALLLATGMIWATSAQAQNCGQAATQGTAPPSWQTYCWLNLTNYNDVTARSASGQNLTFALPDGSTLTFNARVTGGTTTAYNSATAPSWTGAAIGNTAFIGIPGRPVLYTAAAGTRTITLSGITITPPAGATASVFSFIVADAESSNQSESLTMTTNGASWQLLDTVPPVNGAAFPLIAGLGSSTVTINGVAGTVGAHVLGSNSPTNITVQTVAGGLQGVMFAVRFASIRLQKSLVGTRVSASDQFRYEVISNATNTVISGGTTSGSGGGPFTGPPVVMSAGVPVTIRETMAAGSTSVLSQYSSTLTCVNIAGPTRSSLPNNLAVTSFNLGMLQFGEALVCTFTNGARPRLQLRKVLDGDRRFTGDQFTVRIMQGQTVIAASTTTGTGGTVNLGDTGLVTLQAGQSYSIDEIAAGTANLGNYDSMLSCSNATTGTGTTLPTALPGVIVPSVGDTITCVITNERRNTAVLVIDKTSQIISDPVNGTSNPKAIPGAVIEYAVTVRNAGRMRVDANSIVIIDAMPSGMAFAAGTPITFNDGSPASGLSAFNQSTMVSFSSQPGGQGPFNYTPTGAFDQAVRGIRITPAGRMERSSSGTDQPSFTVRFRARVE
ncbi:CshA/CshB family fibrillar adhesin-related protein [Porphyrobacter sp. AAP60]|uniref:CshA/CshB family fibrillar adhesin-related protein n=1 Tax=Porphyrobacter sp. AAP60 TaxID=1523423 RepID=UPI0018D02919|nr:CshA/CshB family fibrillar adhesin-related protein [Porphyrobacter sp. AAP60]